MFSNHMVDMAIATKRYIDITPTHHTHHTHTRIMQMASVGCLQGFSAGVYASLLDGCACAVFESCNALSEFVTGPAALVGVVEMVRLSLELCFGLPCG